MDNSSANIDLIRSHVDIIILKPLETADRYGYEILKEIETNSNGLFKLKQPTMYSCLKRLEKQGFINSYLGDESKGAQRRYYALTQQGKDFLVSQRAQWEFVRTILSGLVSDVDFDAENDVQPFDPSKYRPLTKRTRNTEEEPEVKVVEKVVYVPAEPEKLTKEELLSRLDAEDIHSIVEDYISTHDVELQPKTDDAVDDYIDSMDGCDDSPLDDGYLTDYSSVMNSDAVVEDVALDVDDIDSESLDVMYTEEDLPGVELESFADEERINELTMPQVNRVSIPVESPAPQPTYSSDESVDEESSRFLSYSDDDYAEDSFDAYSDDSDSVDEGTVFTPSEPTMESSPYSDALFDYSKRIETPTSEEPMDSVNVLNALDIIYDDTGRDTSCADDDDDSMASTMQVTYDTSIATSNNAMTISDMKATYMNQQIKIRPYKKTSAIQYYENNYYYANRTARDTSLIMFVLFFVETLITHFVLAPRFALNFGYLVLTWLVGSIVPIFFTLKWAMQRDYKKPTKVNLSLNMMLGLIVLLNIALIIFLVGFFGFGADYTNIDTMILPIITPMVFLVNIPLYSLIYYLLYRSKIYNLR